MLFIRRRRRTLDNLDVAYIRKYDVDDSMDGVQAKLSLCWRPLLLGNDYTSELVLLLASSVPLETCESGEVKMLWKLLWKCPPPNPSVESLPARVHVYMPVGCSHLHVPCGMTQRDEKYKEIDRKLNRQ